MEFNFGLLVLAALAGMVLKLVVGWDPWKLVGSLTEMDPVSWTESMRS